MTITGSGTIFGGGSHAVRVLYIDIDTLRPDHLGCYGYARDTSPNIDRIASEGVRFTNCYASDVPCLPSRSALFTGRHGIHTGVVGHGGTAADPRLEGCARGFRAGAVSWMTALSRAGMYPVTVSPFAERHSAWWFYSGFREHHDTGKRGGEIAPEVQELALPWLRRNAARDDWFLHVNYWDPHTGYRTPPSYGNPFEDDPAPDWLTEEILEVQREGYGPHSAREPHGWGSETWPHPRAPDEIASLRDFKRWIDGYDTGIRYADDHVGELLGVLEEAGVLDDTAVIVSSDHGENQGELNVYGDHHTADHCTANIPLVVRWPGLPGGGRVDRGLVYNLDLAPTVTELVGGEIPPSWDGRSFAQALGAGREAGREFLVLSQCAWSCQRSVREGPWMYVRTYHDGLKDLPPEMLFNIEKDPHEVTDLADSEPEVAARLARRLARWTADMMAAGPDDRDPLWTVMREGGPLHTRGCVESYAERLRRTGRAHHAEAILARHGRNE